MDLVISYYKEDLSWLTKYKHVNFNKIYLYNKGPNPSPESEVPYIEIKLENIGRCDHTYLYHIIHNYDDLGDVTIFTTGSVGLPHKSKKLDFIINKTLETRNSVLEGLYYINLRSWLYNFQIEKYEASYPVNNEVKQPMELSKIRPFGKWYDSHFSGISVNLANYLGIFSVANPHIKQHSKDYYVNLINDFPNNSNPEVGHYFERAWVAVFHPLPNECLYYSIDPFITLIILIVLTMLIIYLVTYNKVLYKFVNTFKKTLNFSGT